MPSSRPIMALLLAASPALAAPVPPIDAARYDRAARFLFERVQPLVRNTRIVPHWRQGAAEHFTWRRALADGGAEFVSVDAATGRQQPAFDATVVAAGLSAATGKPVVASALPFYDYDETATGIRFSAGAKTWDCATAVPKCTDAGIAPPDPMAIASPDGKWRAYVDNGNLWVRSADGTNRFALTSDAVPRYTYAVDPESSYAINTFGPARPPAGIGTSRTGPPTMRTPPALLWSPDSRLIFTNRLDERAVRDKSITQSTPTDGTTGPITWTWKSAQPNDPALPMAESWLFDVAARQGRKLAVPPQPISFMSAQNDASAWWSPDSREVTYLTRSRYAKAMTLLRIDAATGAITAPITETGTTFVEPASLGERPLTRVLANGDVLWFSEQSGYGHLSLRDGRTGAIKRVLTGGSWTVRNVLHVDEPRGLIYVAGNERQAGDDPYWRKVYRIRLSDGATRLLTPEAGDHHVASAQESAGSLVPSPLTRSPADQFGFAPSGRWFLDAHGRYDQPTRFVLRSADGRKIADIATTDASRLVATGWKPPERFSALAADGKTMLYGMLWKPTDFDPAKRYPLLDSIYPGPQSNRVKPGFGQAVADNASSMAWAELGMIVFSVDGRGTPGRSKAFHDQSYGRLGDAGNIDDHIAVARELARRHPWIDLDRVGMYGASGGGYATAHALFTHPEFYRAGVSDAGNHDQRGYLAVWGETYNGPEAGDNYTSAANALLAGGLQGKLLLLHGDMDSNVLPYHSLQVADGLIRANRDFEMLIVPNYGHVTIAGAGYPLRRAWDFMVQNLIGATPPPPHDFTPPAPGARF
ncbi:prolyl oligopeptidase family serine peptidase [Sandarakinorhabdus limnophila]|uniref:prolyl oligopeptidase family serine peptidase n=1 Tax=Sandarakinorhabdus limnophila TaxID=210512 RepID=UPI0026F2A6C4|nr:prolyl oligopeptidase family serine peptidase [Sandarakinorhabdus limnophila]